MYDPNPTKSDANAAKHGVSFAEAEGFEWETALEARDIRKMDEVRTIAIGFIGDDLCVAVYTYRAAKVRFISVRKASKREALRYGGFYD